MKIIAGDGNAYGYRKITADLREDYNLIINHKKVHRLCSELGVLRKRPQITSNKKKKRVKKTRIDGPNQLWEMDLKYGYIDKKNRFFFQLSIIDVHDRVIIDYHLGLSATAKDAKRVLKNALKKRGLINSSVKPAIRTDNGPQFTAKVFQKAVDELRISHEMIPVRTPNLIAHIEGFHSILEDECYSRHEFKDFSHVYKVVTDFIKFYNFRRRHGSLNYTPPEKYHLQVTKESINLAA